MATSDSAEPSFGSEPGDKPVVSAVITIAADIILTYTGQWHHNRFRPTASVSEGLGKDHMHAFSCNAKLFYLFLPHTSCITSLWTSHVRCYGMLIIHGVHTILPIIRCHPPR